MRAFILNLLMISMTFASVVTIGHHAPVTSVGMSIDGRIAVSGGSWPDPTVRIWDLGTGELMDTLNFGNRYNVAAISLDGRYAVIGGDSKFIVLWNISKGSPERVYAGHTKPITSIAIDPLGRYIASGDESGTVKIWRVGSSGIYKNFFAHNGKVTDISFSNDSQFLASSGADGGVVVWKGLYKFPIAKIKMDRDVTSVLVIGNAIVDGSAIVVVGDVSGKVTFFKLEPEKTEEFKILVPYKVEKIKEVKAHSGPIWDLASSPDGSFMASAGNDGRVLVWDTEKMEVVKELSFTGFPIFSVSMTMDGRVLGSDGGGNLVVWDYSTGMVIRIVEGSPMLTDLDVSKDRIVAGYNDGTVKIFTRDGKLLKVMREHRVGNVKVVITDFGIISAGEDGRVVANDLKSFKLKKVMIGRGRRICCMAKDPGGEKLAMVDVGGNLSVWNMKTGLMEMYISTRDPVEDVAIHEDEVITADLNGKLKFWSVSTRRLDKEIDLKVPVKKLGVDHVSETLAVYCEDGYIRIFDLKSSEIVKSFRPVSDNVKDMVYSNGKLYIAGGEDTVEVWDVEKTEPIPGIIAERDSLRVVSVDGNFIVAGGYSGMIYIWDGRKMTSFVGFSDGEYAIFSAGILQTSKKIKGGLAIGVEIITRKKTEVPICPNFKDRRLEMEFKISGESLSGIDVLDKTVYIATKDGSVLVWSLKGGKVVGKYEVSKSEITAIRAGKDGVLVGDKAGNVFLIDLEGKVKKIGRHYGRIRDVDWYEDHPVSVGMDDYLIIWQRKPLKIDVESAYSLYVGGDLALVGGRDKGYVRIYDLKGLKLLEEYKVHEDIVSDLLRYKDEVVSVGMDGLVVLSDIKTGKVVKTLSRSLTNFTSVALNGDVLMAGTAFGDVYLWDLKRSKEIGKVSLWKFPVVSMVAYGKRFIVAGESGTIAVLNLTGKKIAELFIKNPGYVLYKCTGEVLSEGLNIKEIADIYAIDLKGNRTPIGEDELCPVFALDLSE